MNNKPSIEEIQLQNLKKIHGENPKVDLIRHWIQNLTDIILRNNNTNK